MTWWKWLLSTVVYIMLSLSVASGFTLFAEREMRAATISLVFFGLLSIIFGVLLFRFVLKPANKTE
jgi:drug/metabolite transporter (DMT)-like permease